MPDDEESRAFARIVSHLRREDPRFAAGQPRSPRRRILLPAGLALCAAAVLLISFGGTRGAVLALFPWIAGLVMVIRSRAGN